MRRVQINDGQIGLVMNRGNYKYSISTGKHWIGWFDNVVKYDLDKPFTPALNLNIFLQDERLMEHLILVEVPDNKAVLKYIDGNFKALLTKGRYAFWKGLINYSFQELDVNNIEITEDLTLEMKRLLKGMNLARAFVVEPYEKGILFVNGEQKGMLEKGTHYYWNNATTIQVLKADMRQLQMEISGQEILTKDKAALRINFYAQYKVVDIQKAMVENKDFAKQLYILVQLALREFIGTLTLDEILEKKESVAEYVNQNLKEKSNKLGVKVLDTGIRDIILPGDIKEIMNRVLVAQKQAQANTITRREETASTRSLLNTAKLMEDNEMLMKLKEMEYVEKIADKINSISLSGGSQVVDQLKAIFSPRN